MRLRSFKTEDAPVIASWIRTEEEMYLWSADRYNRFPVSGEDILEEYAPQVEKGRFFPLTAVDHEEETVGHFIIRYPREYDDSSVRFGFLILKPELRGQGLGKEMLLLGIEYVKEHLTATRISLGVFEDNKSAKYCYKALGYKEYSRIELELPIGNMNCINMEISVER